MLEATGRPSYHGLGRLPPAVPDPAKDRSRRGSVGAVRAPQVPLRGHERPFSVRAEPEPAPVHLRYQSRTGAGSDRTSVIKVIPEPAPTHPHRQTRSGAGSAKATTSSCLPSYREADRLRSSNRAVRGGEQRFEGSPSPFVSPLRLVLQVRLEVDRPEPAPANGRCSSQRQSGAAGLASPG